MGFKNINSFNGLFKSFPRQNNVSLCFPSFLYGLHSSSLLPFYGKISKHSFSDTESDYMIRIFCEGMDKICHVSLLVQPFLCIHIIDERGVLVDNFFTSPSKMSKGKKQYTWDEEIIIPKSYQNFAVLNSILFLEVLDGGNTLIRESKKTFYKSCRKVAWGFLKPQNHIPYLNSEGTKETDFRKLYAKGKVEKNFKLQLYKYQKNSWLIKSRIRQLASTLTFSKYLPDVCIQLLRKKRIPFQTSIHIKIGPVIKQNISDKLGLEKAKIEEVTMKKELNKYCSKERLQDEDCIIPDVLLSQLINSNIHVSTIEFSISGKFLAIGGVSVKYGRLKSFPIIVYDICSLKRIFIFEYGHKDTITDISWSLDDYYLASASIDRTIQLHNIHLEQNSTKMESESTSLVILNMAYPQSIAFVLENTVVPLLISASNDNRVTLWKIAEQMNVGELGGKIIHKASVNVVRVNPKSRIVYSGDELGCIIFWQPNAEVRTGDDYVPFRYLNGLNDISSGRIIGISCNEPRYTEHSVRCKRQLAIIIGDNESYNVLIYNQESERIEENALDFNNKEVQSAVFSPDGKLIIAGMSNGRLNVFDTISGIRKKVCFEFLMHLFITFHPPSHN